MHLINAHCINVTLHKSLSTYVALHNRAQDEKKIRTLKEEHRLNVFL